MEIQTVSLNSRLKRQRKIEYEVAHPGRRKIPWYWNTASDGYVFVSVNARFQTHRKMEGQVYISLRKWRN